MFILYREENRIPVSDLERRLHVAYPTAWRMKHRIRYVLPEGRKEMGFRWVLQHVYMQWKTQEIIFLLWRIPCKFRSGEMLSGFLTTENIGR